MKNTMNIGSAVEVEGHAAIVTGVVDNHGITVRHFHTGEEFEVDITLVKSTPNNSDLDAQNEMHRLAHVNAWEI